MTGSWRRRSIMQLASGGLLGITTRELAQALEAEVATPAPTRDAYDAIVIGLGAMGSACLSQLACRGASVLGLEQFDIAHTLGSSGGLSRQTKVLPYVGSRFEPIIRRANDNWARLEQDSGQRIFERCGWLLLGVGDRQPAAAVAATCQRIEPAALAERYPHFANLPIGTSAILDREGGFLRPELAIASQCRMALAKGAHIRAREPVTAWESDGAGVRVATEKGIYRARHLVVATGAWTGKLVPALRERLAVTRLTLGWFATRPGTDFSPAAFPTWCDGDYYGFPEADGFPGVKVAKHWRGDPADPDTIDRMPNTQDEKIVRGYLSRHLPGADGDVLALKVCMYVHGGPWLGPLPGHPRVTAIAACNGGGFKFSSAYGEALADFATTGRTELPVGFMAFPS